MNEQVNSGADNAAPAPNADANTPQDTRIPTSTNSTGTRDVPTFTQTTEETNPALSVDNATQVSPDAGTGGNAQTEDVGQQSMASTATAAPDSPVPNTVQAARNSEILADALNKELGNNVSSMVEPGTPVLEKDSAPVVESLTAVASALVDAGIVTPATAAAAVSSISKTLPAPPPGPSLSTSTSAPSDSAQPTPEGGVNDSRKTNELVAGPSDVRVGSDSESNPSVTDSSTGGVVSADSTAGNGTVVPSNKEPTPGASESTTTVSSDSKENIKGEVNVQAPSSSGNTSTASTSNTNFSGNDTDSNSQHTLGNESNSTGSNSENTQNSDSGNDNGNVGLPVRPVDRNMDSDAEQKPSNQGDVNEQDNSNGPAVSDTGGSGNTAEPTQPSSPGGEAAGTDGGGGNAAPSAPSAEGSSAGAQSASDPQPSALSTPTDSAGAEGSGTSGSQTSAPNPPDEATVSPSVPESSATPASDIPPGAVVDSQTGAPAVTVPSTSIESTATATPATEPTSTPAEDTSSTSAPTPNTDATAPVPPNTQTTDTPGPAPTLPSSPDPVSADKTTSTSVDSPNPQTDVTPAPAQAQYPVLTDSVPPPPVLTDVVTPTPAATTTVVNTGVQDSSTSTQSSSTPSSPTPVTDSTTPAAATSTTPNETEVVAPPPPPPGVQSTPSTTQGPSTAPQSTVVPAQSSHGPTGIAEVDRILQHLPASALGPIYAIKNYMTMMAPRKPMDAKTGAQHQVTLYRAITNIINREEEHFEALFTAMLKMFEHGKDDVFQETHVFRFQESVNLNADEQKGFQRLVNLFKVMGPVQDRSIARKQVRVEESLSHGLTDEGRSRVLSYFDPNGR